MRAFFLNLFLSKFLKLLGRWNGSHPSQTSMTKVLLFLKYVHRLVLILVWKGPKYVSGKAADRELMFVEYLVYDATFIVLSHLTISQFT